MAPTGRPALGRLVGNVDDFECHHWGRAPAFVKSDDMLDDVLSVEAFERWLSAAPRRPTVRLVRDGNDVPESRYCRPTRLGSRTLPDVVDHAALLAQFQGGATVVGQSLHRVIPSVADFAQALEQDLTHRVQVNAYLTPPCSAGLTEHSDGHHVIAVQLRGHKWWEVDGLGAVRMEPGARLYVPSGVRHSARSTTAPSLHLTVGIHAVSLRAVAHAALAAIPALDAPLPIGFGHLDDAQWARMVRSCISDAGAVADLDPADVDRALILPRRRRRIVGAIGAAFVASDLTADSLVRWRSDRNDARVGSEPPPMRDPGAVGWARADTPHTVIRCADLTVRLPGHTLGAVEHLRSGRPTAIGTLPGLDAVSQAVVARRLVEVGVLEVIA